MQTSKQVEKKGETVDLLIDLFYMAMHDRRPELAFPSTVRYVLRNFVFRILVYFLHVPRNPSRADTCRFVSMRWLLNWRQGSWRYTYCCRNYFVAVTKELRARSCKEIVHHARQTGSPTLSTVLLNRPWAPRCAHGLPIGIPAGKPMSSPWAARGESISAVPREPGYS